MHMMESNLKSINTKSDEKVYVSCCVKQSIAACLEYGVLIGNIFIEGVSRELACLSRPQLVIVHMNLECMHF